MKRLVLSGLCALLPGAPALAQTDGATADQIDAEVKSARERLLRAIRLPGTSQEARRAGVPQEDPGSHSFVRTSPSFASIHAAQERSSFTAAWAMTSPTCRLSSFVSARKITATPTTPHWLARQDIVTRPTAITPKRTKATAVLPENAREDRHERGRGW